MKKILNPTLSRRLLSRFIFAFFGLKIKNLSFPFLNQQNLEKIVMFKIRKRKTVL
jgi:hypothetical protein